MEDLLSAEKTMVDWSSEKQWSIGHLNSDFLIKNYIIFGQWLLSMKDNVFQNEGHSSLAGDSESLNSVRTAANLKGQSESLEGLLRN